MFRFYLNSQNRRLTAYKRLESAEDFLCEARPARIDRIISTHPAFVVSFVSIMHISLSLPLSRYPERSPNTRALEL